jgi:hypothetical protein
MIPKLSQKVYKQSGADFSFIFFENRIVSGWQSFTFITRP